METLLGKVHFKIKRCDFICFWSARLLGPLSSKAALMDLKCKVEVAWEQEKGLTEYGVSEEEYEDFYGHSKLFIIF